MQVQFRRAPCQQSLDPILIIKAYSIIVHDSVGMYLYKIYLGYITSVLIVMCLLDSILMPMILKPLFVCQIIQIGYVQEELEIFFSHLHKISPTMIY